MKSNDGGEKGGTLTNSMFLSSSFLRGASGSKKKLFGSLKNRPDTLNDTEHSDLGSSVLLPFLSGGGGGWEGSLKGDVIRLVDEMPPSFRDGGRNERERKGKDKKHRASLMGMEEDLGEGASSGLDLNLTSDLNATLSGTHHSLLQARSFDGFGSTGGRGNGSKLDTTVTSSWSGTGPVNTTATNLNETLGQSKRAEMLTHSFSEDPPLVKSFLSSIPQASGIEGLRAAVRDAEQLHHSGGPQGSSFTTLAPPQTHEAIYRLYGDASPAAGLASTVSGEPLSVQRLRRLFGPPNTLVKNSNEEGRVHRGKADLNEQYSVCSEAATLFNERVPSTNATLMAVSRRELVSETESQKSMSMLYLLPPSPPPPPSPKRVVAEPPEIKFLPRREKKEGRHSSPASSALNPLYMTPKALELSKPRVIQNAIRERDERCERLRKAQQLRDESGRMVEQWIDRTFLMQESGEDPSKSHDEAMHRVGKEEEETRSKYHYSQLQLRERLRLQSKKARERPGSNFQRGSAEKNAWKVHQDLCSAFDPFDVRKKEPLPFRSAVPLDDLMEDMASLMTVGVDHQSTRGFSVCSINRQRASPLLHTALTTEAEAYVSPTEAALLEFVLVALVEESEWGNKTRPFQAKLPCMVLEGDDPRSICSQLAKLYLENALPTVDLCCLLDIHAGLEKAVDYGGVAPPPPRPQRAGSSTSSGYLSLQFPPVNDSGLPGMAYTKIDVLPLLLHFTVGRSAEHGGSSQCTASVDLLDLFRHFPVLVAEQLVLLRGGGAEKNPNYSLSLPTWCMAVWRRLVLEIERLVLAQFSAEELLAVGIQDIAGGVVEHCGFTNCFLEAFEVDWKYCLDLISWRTRTLKQIAHRFSKVEVGTPEAIVTPHGSPLAALPASSTSHLSSIQGPKMCGNIPIAPGHRGYYLLDMKNLYVSASLALDQNNQLLFTRAEKLKEQYRELEAFIRSENGIVESLSGAVDIEHRIGMGNCTPPVASLSLATAFKQWAGVQKLLELESEYAFCLNSIHSNEACIINFNALVVPYNEFRSRESLIWGPLYKSGLRLAYALCLFIENRSLDMMPEKMLAFIGPLCQFSGCVGGYREMKGNVKEVKNRIEERCRRVAVAVQVMTIEDAEALLRAALEALEQCGEVSHIVSFEAGEGDVLTTAILTVPLPEKTFEEVDFLV